MTHEKEPWIETRQGEWFFLNAVLVAPELVVLVPLALGLAIGFLVPDRGTSPFLDTIPFVASRSLPVVGWLLVIPIWTTLKNLRMKGPLLPRLVLGVFLVSHLAFLGYAVRGWVG